MNLSSSNHKIFITGGGGYIGSALVPKLLSIGCRVRVYDLFLYGENTLKPHPKLQCIKGDIRDRKTMMDAAKGSDVIIHLASVSNDSAAKLNPAVGKSINLDAFHNILDTIRRVRPERFIYTSSSSVYGPQNQPDIYEDTPARPITNYSKQKLECEYILREAVIPDVTTWSTIRPATVCGYASRLRLDLVVNTLTINALENRCIRVFGGNQLRPNITMEDMVRAYVALLEAPAEKVQAQTFNVGHDNLSLERIANVIKIALHDHDIKIIKEPSNDLRSYHINSGKIKQHIGFVPKYELNVAVQDLNKAYRHSLIENGLNNPLYHNIKRMQAIALK